MLTGSIMILACFAFGVIILNDPKMKIPFSNPVDHTVFVDPQFGWSWYLTLFTGIGTLVLGLVVLLMDFFLPRKIAVVFHHSVVEEDEFFAVSAGFRYLYYCHWYISVCACSKMRTKWRR